MRKVSLKISPAMTIILSAAILMGAKCDPNASTPVGSELSAISFTLPEGNYDTAQIELKRHGDSVGNASCSADATSTESTSGGKLEVNKSVKNGCSYILILTLGTRQENQFYAKFSNKYRDKPGEIFLSRDLVGGTIERHIVVYRLEGPQQGKPLNPTPDTTDLSVEVEFGGQPATQSPPEEQQPEQDPPGRQTNPEQDPPGRQGDPAPGPADPPRENKEPPKRAPEPNQAATGNIPNETVANFLNTRCFECHAGQGIAYNFGSFPFQVEGNQDQKAILGEIISAVSGDNPRMPPGPRDKATAEEIAALRAWMESL